MIRRKAFTFPVVLTEHEEHEAEPGRLKELVLVIDWTRPLHVVMIVDAVREEERIVTVYEPDHERWSHDYRRRRR